MEANFIVCFEDDYGLQVCWGEEMEKADIFATYDDAVKFAKEQCIGDPTQPYTVYEKRAVVTAPIGEPAVEEIIKF